MDKNPGRVNLFWWLSSKEFAYQCRMGRSPGEGNGNPLQYSCLGNSSWTEEHGGLQPMGSQKSGTGLNDWTITYRVTLKVIFIEKPSPPQHLSKSPLLLLVSFITVLFFYWITFVFQFENLYLFPCYYLPPLLDWKFCHVRDMSLFHSCFQPVFTQHLLCCLVN